MSKTRKKILVGIILTFLILIFSLLYTINSSNNNSSEEDKNTPDYKALLQSAIKDLDEADNAIIYKDYDKANELLDKSMESVGEIYPSSSLYNEAKSLIKKIEEKREKIKELKEKEQESSIEINNAPAD